MRLWNDLGSFAHVAGDHDAALDYYDRAERLHLRLSDAEPSILHRIRANRSATDVYTGNWERAEATLRETLQAQELGTPGSSAVAETLVDLAEVLNIQDRKPEALELLDRARVIQERHLGADDPALLDTWVQIGNAANFLGESERGFEAWSRHREIAEKVLGTDHRVYATSLFGLGQALEQQDDLDGAREMLEQSLALREKHIGANHPDYSASLTALGVVEFRAGNLAASEHRLRQALAVDETNFGPGPSVRVVPGTSTWRAWPRSAGIATRPWPCSGRPWARKFPYDDMSHEEDLDSLRDDPEFQRILSEQNARLN